MGIFSKVLGRKRDELGLDDVGKDLNSMPNFNEPLGSPDMGLGAPGMPPAGQQPAMTPEAMGFERMPNTQPSYAAPSQQSLSEINMGKDLEIISAKLDAIKAELDSMSQRLKRLERLAEGESSTSRDKWGY